jgi:hypothetical protein
MLVYDALFNFADFTLFLISLVTAFLLSGIALLISAMGKKIWPSKAGGILVSTTMSVTVVPAALMLTFIANDVWNVDSKAKTTVVREGIAVSESFKLIRHLPQGSQAPLQQALWAYGRSVATDDWTELRQRSASEKTDEAMQRLRTALYEANQDAPASSTPALAALADEIKVMVEMKEARRSLALLDVSPVKWTVLWLLFFVNACTLCELNRHHLRERITGLVLASLAFSSICWLILIYDRPFAGTTSIHPDIIEHALAKNPANIRQ